MWVIPEDEATALEAVGGRKPWGILEIHPSRSFAALTFGKPADEQAAAVWSLVTGRVFWAPHGAQVIAWNSAGSEVVVVAGEEPYKSGRLQRYTWPGRELLGETAIPMRGYMYLGARVSPAEGLAAVVDIDQDLVAIALYALPTGQTRIRSLGEVVRKPNEIHEIEFTSDGNTLVWTISADGEWWTPNFEGGKVEPGPRGQYPPSPGGTFRAGEICMWRGPGGNPMDLRLIDVEVPVAPGWRPSATEGPNMILGPILVDDRHFKIRLPTGEWNTYDFDGRLAASERSDKDSSYADAMRRSIQPAAPP